MLVFDSGALIALLRLERGALTVRQLLRTHRGVCVVHAVNWLEIYYGFARADGKATAERAWMLLQNAGIEVRNDMDETFLRDAGDVKILHRMALGDCFGVALARKLGAIFVTADHHEMDTVAKAETCRVLFIR